MINKTADAIDAFESLLTSLHQHFSGITDESAQCTGKLCLPHVLFYQNVQASVLCKCGQQDPKLFDNPNMFHGDVDTMRSLIYFFKFEVDLANSSGDHFLENQMIQLGLKQQSLAVVIRHIRSLQTTECLTPKT